jgi:hypothetical protein
MHKIFKNKEDYKLRCKKSLMINRIKELESKLIDIVFDNLDNT